MKFTSFALIAAVLNLLDYSCAEVKCQNRIKLLDDYIQDQREKWPMQAIRPKLLHGRHKRSIKHTLEENGMHVDHLILTYRHNDKDVIIDLRLNTHLIPEGHFISSQTKDGGKIIKTLNKTEINLCHYHGTIRGSNKSRVALSTCNGIDGIIFDEQTTYHIQPGPDARIDSEHFIVIYSDAELNARCGNVDRPINNTVSHAMFEKFESNINGKLRYKRDASDSSLLLPYNSNKDTLYLELLVVVDYDSYKNLKKDLGKVHNYVKSLVNIANSFYIPLNIFIALSGVVVWTERDEIVLTGDGEITLSKFVKYRKEKLIIANPNDNAHLLLNKPFDGGVVGIAYEGLMCTSKFSGGITTIHSSFIGVVATTMAHEIGHNFGLEHDNPHHCKCIDSGCIMNNSTTKVSPKHWSSCSLDQLSLSLYKGVSHCLKNKPTKLFGSGSCGNGFIDLGEECDCGLPKDCTNACCNATTCKLHTNATCANGKCCDLTTCQTRIAGYECRKAQGDCDLSEYCTGKSEYCPIDVFKRDTELCGLGHAYCHEGKCRSHLDQCKLLWGVAGQPVYQCFYMNEDGSSSGNCGFNKQTQKYIRCKEEDVYCGLLHCRKLVDSLQYGLHHQSTLHEVQIRPNDNVIKCFSAILNLDSNSIDPGLTPQGAMCGENKMCVDQKCVSIDQLRARGIGAPCPENCNGNGVCNNKDNCHCSLGFAPPTCKGYGIGGSIDSGPLIHVQETPIIPLLFIIGVLLIIVIVTFGIVYWHRHTLIPTPREIARRLSTAPREMIEIIRRVSIPPKEIVRRISIAPREIARRVSNAYNNATTIQVARSRLKRTDGPHGLYNSREVILNVDEVQ